MAVDLLDGFTFGPTTPPDEVNNQYFEQHFWWSSSKTGSSQDVQGDKNQGFDVLYHNMKHGQTSVTSLKDFIRESANSEDLYAKYLTKLAKQAANSSPVGSFAPMFDVFKVMAEKLSSCHMDVVHKLHEIIKELAKYFDEQRGKHKQVKDELGGTADALHHIQNTTTAVQKSKEKYHQLCVEAERLKRAGALSKEIEKADTKCRKASEDYRNLVHKYTTARADYEQKMTDSAKRFQEIEVAHLKHMKSVLDTYILSYENANVLMSQVYQEFRRQVDENTIDSLIKKYSESKGTGTEKPAPIVFEECDVSSMLVSVESPHTNGVSNDESATHTQPPNKGGRRPIALPFRRKKPRNKQNKDNSPAVNKEQDKEADLMESPDKDSSVKIDEEGYTIRPETPKESKSSWGFDSSDDSDSDSDDITHRKIHVKINPKDEVATATGDNNLIALNAITRNLTLNSPTTVGGKKLARRDSNRETGTSPVAAGRRVDSNSDTDSFGSLPRASTRPHDNDSSGFSNAFPFATESSPKPTSPKPRLGGAVKVLPSVDEASAEKHSKAAPVPAPRRYSNKDYDKLSARRRHLQSTTANRFSTVFVPYESKESGDSVDSDKHNDSRREQFVLSEGSDFSSDESYTKKSTENLASGVRGLGTPIHIRPFLTPQHTPARPVASARSLARPILATSPKSPPHSNASGLGIDSPLVKLSKPPRSPGRRKSPNENEKKQSELASQKTEKSQSESILDLFGNTSTSTTSKARAPPVPNSSTDILSEFFGSKSAFPVPTTGSTSAPQSSSNPSPTNLFALQADKDSDKEVADLKSVKASQPFHVNSIDLTTSSATSRPNNLTLTTNAWTEPIKGTPSAPLASSESWSSLSSLGGTPMDSFASSRGPSPLTLAQGDPIPIAVAFTETINAYFKGPGGDRCMAKITGEVQISFPAGIVRAFTSNVNPAVLSFRLKGNSKLQNVVPNKTYLCSDTFLPDASEHSFWFDMTSLTSSIKKMAETNPNSPYYNIQILTYQLTSQSGHSIVPLHLTSQWKCDVDATNITIDYKYNGAATSSPLKNVQVIVPVDGGVGDAQSTPSANWMSAQNRLLWKLASPISSSAPTATLKSKLTLNAGPSKSTSLAVQFVSEGSTLTGSDFELTGSGYRLSLVKKRYSSGKYLLDAS